MRSDLALRLPSALVLGAAVFCAVWFGGVWYELFVLLFTGAALWELTELGKRLPVFWTAVFSMLIVLAAVSLDWLRDQALGRDQVFFLILAIMACDTGAYFVGRVVGGPRLAPKISPGKTRSGALGGVAAAMVAGVVFFRLLEGVWSWRIALLGGILAVAGQCGDLAESALKRRAGVKDSGWLVPGHGGVLDRADGFLAAAPVGAVLIRHFLPFF